MRINTLKTSAFKDGKLDCFLVFNGTNLTYFTGFPGAAALLVPQQGDGILYVSAVNYEQAKVGVKGLTVEQVKLGENLMEKIGKQVAPAKKVAVDTLPVEAWRALGRVVGGEEKLTPAGNMVRQLRMVKDSEEIALIREACKLANLGMKVASETVRPGVKEREVAAELEYAMRKKGSDGTSFDTIIASGASSAFPHGSCSNRTIREGDLVVVDLGATYKFYRSDMTRTFVAGKPAEKQTKIYEIVKQANQKAFEAIKPNIGASLVDEAARGVIETSGFGEFFCHNLGHGVGLEIHEAPVLSIDSKDVLAAGNVVTDEPGVYLPTYGGVRLEDTVLVTQSGAKKLTVGAYSLQTGR